MEPVTLYKTLERHIPPVALPYCFRLWEEHPFLFTVKRTRITKVGDFMWRPGRPPRISVNRESHPYLFLITYIHGVAHLRVHQEFGPKVDPHGREWKSRFQQLMDPVMKEEVFPGPLLRELRKHMKDPMASSFSDPVLTQALRNHDEKQKNVILLHELPEGSVFGLHGKWFRKGKTRRTRVMCSELNSRRNYLVPVDAPVEQAQLRFPGFQ